MDERNQLTEWKSWGAGFAQLAADAKLCLTQSSLVLLMLSGGLQMAMCEYYYSRSHAAAATFRVIPGTSQNG